MRANFADIARLCAECQSLIDCHDKIAVLSEVHYNLRKTLQVGLAGRSKAAQCCFGAWPAVVQEASILRH